MSEQLETTDDQEPKAVRGLNKTTAIVAAVGALVAALVLLITNLGELVDLVNGGDGVEKGSAAQTASVVVAEPLVQGSTAAFDVGISVSGGRGSDLRLTWTLYDAAQGRPVAEDGFAKQLVADFTPTADPFERSYQATVPVPETTDLVFLRAELFEGAERLALGDSDRLRIGGFSP